MKATVVDASVALKWLVEEDGSAEAEALLTEDLVAPALMRIEAANVLRTLVRCKILSEVDAQNLLQLLQEVPATIVEHDDELERRGLEIALQLGHPVYDCLYLALAERIDACVVTADKKFVRALADTAFERLARPL